MEKFQPVKGRSIPMSRSDVDTDQIISKEFLKRIERTGFGPYAFDTPRDTKFHSSPNVEVEAQRGLRARLFDSRPNRLQATRRLFAAQGKHPVNNRAKCRGFGNNWPRRPGPAAAGSRA